MSKTKRSAKTKLPIFNSMEQCEGIAHVPKSIQRDAKKDGCEAFDGYGRVHLGELLRWIFDEGADSDKTNWKKVNERLDSQLKELRLAREVRTVITLEEAQTFMSDLMGLCTNAMKRFLLECPVNLEMRPRMEIRAAMDKCYWDTLAKMRSEIAAMESEPKKHTSPETKPE
jgi:hypothetical protein